MLCPENVGNQKIVIIICLGNAYGLAERVFMHRHFIENQSESPHINSFIVGHVQINLWRHVKHRSDGRVIFCDVAADKFCDTEISDFHAEILVGQDVFGLYIAVYDALGVKIFNSNHNVLKMTKIGRFNSLLFYQTYHEHCQQFFFTKLPLLLFEIIKQVAHRTVRHVLENKVPVSFGLIERHEIHNARMFDLGKNHKLRHDGAKR